MTRQVAFFVIALVLFLVALLVSVTGSGPTYAFPALEAGGLAAFVLGFIP